MDMTAEEFLNKKYNGKGYSAKVHDWNKSTHHNIVLPNLLEEYASIKTKELEKQLQKEAMKQLSLLDQIKELEEEKRELLIEYDQWMSNPEDKIHRSVSEALVDDFLSQNKH